MVNGLVPSTFYISDLKSTFNQNAFRIQGQRCCLKISCDWFCGTLCKHLLTSCRNTVGNQVDIKQTHNHITMCIERITHVDNDFVLFEITQNTM